MKKSKIQVVLIVMTCLALVFTGCGDKPAAEKEKVLKVGVLLPMTGDQAQVGTEMYNACQMALEETDYKVGDYKLDVKLYDHTTDPEKGSLALENAIVKDGIDVAFLNWSSSVALASMDIVARYKIPYYFPFGATGAIDDKWNSDPEKYSYYIGKGWAQSKYLSYAYAEVVNSAIEQGSWTPRNKKAVIFGDDTDYARGCCAAMKEALTASGWEVVFEDYFAMNTTDFVTVLGKMKNLDASLIASSIDVPAAAAAFLKQAREVDLNSLMICDDLGAVANFHELTGSASDYVIDQSPKYTNQAGYDFSAAYEKKYGTVPAAGSAGLAYDYTHLFIKCCEGALEKYGELNSETMYQYAQEVLMTGQVSLDDGVVCPRLKFDKSSKFAPGPIVGEDDYIFPVIQYFEGKGTAIWPDSKKEADILIPDYAK